MKPPTPTAPVTPPRWRPTVRGSHGSVPRAYATHNSSDGRAYGRYVKAMRARLGVLPAAADVTLREAGMVSVELLHLSRDLEQARRRGRKQDVARTGRAQFKLRNLLNRLEDKLAGYANQNGHRGRSLADVMAGDD